jgi:type 1 glutamine amidotransferase/HEAT repeat protein
MALTLTTLALLVSSVHAADAVPNSDELAAMEAAVPAQPVAAVQSPARILVFTRTAGFRHSSIPYASAALEVMGRRSGAFETVVSDDPAMFEPDVLAGFDAVCINNCTGDFLAPADGGQGAADDETTAWMRRREALLAFVRAGGGLIGIHAATDACYDWAEYGEMIGGYFNGHPWNETVTVGLDDPGHPLVRAFRGQSFAVADEIYQFRAPYSREKLRVLLSLDTDRTNMDKGEALGRDDDDYAVTWVREYGEGRVFYCSLGHRHEIFWNAPVLTHYLAGIQYALGQLEADATPSAVLTEAYLERSREQGFEAGVQALFAEMPAYELGSGNTPAMIDDLVVHSHGDETMRSVLERKLIALLESSEANAESRSYACRQLMLIGTDACIPTLLRLTTVPESEQIALYALRRIRSADADAAILAAARSESPGVRVGALNALALRPQDGDTDLLVTMLGHAHTDTARAAALALAADGGTGVAERLLDAARAADEPDLVRTFQHAALDCLERAVTTDDADRALAMLKRVARGEGHTAGRAYALVLTLLPDGERGEAVTNGLLGGDPEIRRAALAAARELPGSAVTEALKAAVTMPELPNWFVSQVLLALRDRGDSAAMPAVLELLSREPASDDGVLSAAFAAATVLGTAEDVPALTLAVSGCVDKSAAQTAGRLTLDRLAATGVTAALRDLAVSDTAAAPVRVEAVRALGARLDPSASPTLLYTALDTDEDVRAASLDAIARIAAPEHAPGLVELLPRLGSAAERRTVTRTLASLARDEQSRDQVLDPVLAAVAAGPEPEVETALLDVLGGAPSERGRPVLENAALTGGADAAKAAVRALSEWPNPSPMPTLWQIAQHADDEVLGILALRGYARLLGLPSASSVSVRLQQFRNAMDLCERVEEKRVLISGLQHLAHPGSLELLEAFMEDRDLEAEARLAASQLVRILAGGDMTATASQQNGATGNAFDRNRDTRWTTGMPMEPGQWFAVDLGFEDEIREISLDAGDTGNDYPRGYEVYVSQDGEDWGDPVTRGEGTGIRMRIELPGTPARFVRIVQTGTSDGSYWSICEIQINGRPVPPSGAPLPRDNWKVSASHNGAEAGNAIDGDLGTRWATGAYQAPGQSYTIDLGATCTVERVVMDAGSSTGDYPRGYEVYVADTDGEWGAPVAKGQGSLVTDVGIYPVDGRYIQVRQTGTVANLWWSIHELTVYGSRD